MSVRDAKAPGIALAGVAVVGLVLGGVFVTDRLQTSTKAAPVKPVLVAKGPSWHDGYNHFVVTVGAPLAPAAAKILAESRAQSGQRGLRQAAATRSAADIPRPLTAAQLTVAIQRSTPSSRQSAPAATSPTVPYSVPWQSVTPNANDPIVLRAGQPMSLLPKALAGYPKGTRLERDRDGNIRAVLPVGWRHRAGPKPAVHAQRSGHTHSGEVKRNPGAHVVKPATGELPPGWLPDATAVVASLLKLPEIHSASPVWGDRYQVATSLTAAQLRSVPGIGVVASNNLLSFAAAPGTNDPQLNQEYYLANTGQSVEGQAGTVGASGDFSYAWARTRGAGVVIADIDTGVDEANPDLAGQILPSSEDFAVSPPSSDVQANGTGTGFYHATTVDGVLAAVAGNGWGGAGAAPEAKILALKCGDDDSLSDSCIYAAGEYAISQHVQIINMSFGEQVSSDPTLGSLVSDAQSAGILVTASAGNWGANNDATPVLPAGYCTSYSNVISVAASDNQDNLASYSDYGATTVDLMAPGSDMFTDYPTYTGFDNAYVSGTSYAAPMVAAAAAELWSVNPTLSYTAVRQDILGSVQTVAAFSGKSVTGGRLDAEAALAQVAEPVQFSFTDFDQVQPQVAANVSISASAQAGALPTGAALGYHLELVYNYSGTMYHVVGQTLNWSVGASGTQSVQTGSDGSAFIAPAGITSANYGSNPLDLTVPSPGLASGTYAVVAYAARTSTPTVPIGNPQAVFFNVGQPSPTPAVTTTTTAGGSGGGTSTSSTTVAPGSSTTTATTSPTTTTTAGAPATTLGTSPLPSIGGGPSTTNQTTTTTAVGGTTTSSTVPTATTTSAVTTTTTAGGTTTTTAANGTTTTAPGPTTTTTSPGPTTTTLANTTTTGATTTTTGATTTTVPAVTTTTGATTSTTAGFNIVSITPNQLPASGGDISIFGTNLPSNAVVTVGAVDEAISNASSTEIDIMVSAMTPGNYSVTVFNANQSQSSTLPNALTIGTPGTTTTTSPGSGATTTTTSGGATTTTSSGGASTTTTTSAGATTTTAGGATTTTAVTTTTSAATTTTAPVTTTTGPGGTILGPNGMVLAPVASSDPINEVPVGEWPAFTASQINADNNAASGTPVDGVDI